MKKVAPNQAEPIIQVVRLIEQVIGKRRLDKAFHRDEVEKAFTYLLQGRDTLDAYERRDAGVDDATWQDRVQRMRDFLNLEGKRRGKDSLFT